MNVLRGRVMTYPNLVRTVLTVSDLVVGKYVLLVLLLLLFNYFLYVENTIRMVRAPGTASAGRIWVNPLSDCCPYFSLIVIMYSTLPS